MTPAQMHAETLTCDRCGSDWTRERKNGPKPRLCPECRSADAHAGEIHRVGGGTRNTAPVGCDVTTAAYRVAAAAVTYRLAIEEATYLLENHRPAEALAVLHRVPAPARTTQGGTT